MRKQGLSLLSVDESRAYWMVQGYFQVIGALKDDRHATIVAITPGIFDQ